MGIVLLEMVIYLWKMVITMDFHMFFPWFPCWIPLDHRDFSKSPGLHLRGVGAAAAQRHPKGAAGVECLRRPELPGTAAMGIIYHIYHI